MFESIRQIRARQKAEAVKREAENCISRLTSVYSGYRQRVTSAAARYILLNHATAFLTGRMYNVKAKSVGCGVYEVWLEERK